MALATGECVPQYGQTPAASAAPLTDRLRWFNFPGVDGSADLIGFIIDEKWGREKSRVTLGGRRGRLQRHRSASQQVER